MNENKDIKYGLMMPGDGDYYNKITGFETEEEVLLEAQRILVRGCESVRLFRAIKDLKLKTLPMDEMPIDFDELPLQ